MDSYACVNAQSFLWFKLAGAELERFRGMFQEAALLNLLAEVEAYMTGLKFRKLPEAVLFTDGDWLGFFLGVDGGSCYSLGMGGGSSDITRHDTGMILLSEPSRCRP